MSRLSERNPLNKQESFFEEIHRLKQEAKKLAELNKNKKVDRYDIKI